MQRALGSEPEELTGKKDEALGPGSHAKWVCWSRVFQMNRPIQVKPAASEGRGGNFPV